MKTKNPAVIHRYNLAMLMADNLDRKLRRKERREERRRRRYHRRWLARIHRQQKKWRQYADWLLKQALPPNAWPPGLRLPGAT